MHPLPKAPTQLDEPASAAIRSWRWFFSLYFVALTIGTHWPRLDPLGPEHTPPDKLMHFLAFGILAVLLERTRWLPRGWMAFALVGLWIPFDEWTQDLLSPWRNWSLPDVLAGIEGLAAAAISTAAVSPPAPVSPSSPWRTAVATIDRIIERGAGGRTVFALSAAITIVVFPVIYFLVWGTLHRSWSVACGFASLAIAGTITLPMGHRAWKRAGGPSWPPFGATAWVLVATSTLVGWLAGELLSDAGLPGLVAPTALLGGVTSLSVSLRQAWMKSETLAHE
ncbi:MAG: hypothetical protein QGI75_07450 [Phycisphaerales bacterium]|jgi:hypothetical protein|nr:hypothetical protein [Phycisphaerales bacterium]MDP6890302.1 hypothetical protein [Phycisphaerales bacterium]